jgi:hypothetical protein
MFGKTFIKHQQMKRYALIGFASLLVFSACKPNDPEPETKDEGVDMVIKFRPTFKGNDITWSKEYITDSGDSIMIDKWKFLLSDFTFEKTSGELVVLKDQYAYLSLKELRDSVILHKVPKGDYKSVRFYVGLDSAVNHGDPLQYASDHPLSPGLNGMHWGWSGGYIFNIVEGYYKNGGVNAGFSYHIATPKYARIYSFIYDYKVSKNARFTFEAKLDKYFNNVVNFNIKTDGSFSHSSPTDAVMDKFIQNVNGVLDLQDFQ